MCVWRSMDLLVECNTTHGLTHLHVVETLSNPISPLAPATCWCCFSQCLAFIVSGVVRAGAACVHSCWQEINFVPVLACQLHKSGWLQKKLKFSYISYNLLIECYLWLKRNYLKKTHYLECMKAFIQICFMTKMSFTRDDEYDMCHMME